MSRFYMKKSLNFLLAAAVTSFLFMACNKEKPDTVPTDETAPKIIMSSPQEVGEGSFIPLTTVDSIIVDIRFEDDFELERYEITINQRFDLNFLKTNNFPWSETYYGALEGTVGGFNDIIFVVFDPDAGPYEFRVKVWDKAGHMTEKVTYLYITNLADPNPPTFATTAPNQSMVDTFMIGDNIIIQSGLLDAGNQIRDAWVRVRNTFTKEIMDGSEIFWDTLFVSSVAIDTFVNIPAGTVPGDYWVEIFAGDNVRNVGKDTTRVHIRN